MTELKAVRGGEVLNIWPDIESHVIRAIERGGSNWTPEEVKCRLLTRNFQLWMADRSALITEIAQQPRGLVCTLVLFSSEDMEEVIGHLDKIEEWARQEGCNCMAIYGRMGWRRALESENYNVRAIELEKAI